MIDNKIKLSIITINYNNLEGLRRTIKSVEAQTWRDFEWILVDGGSTDGSRELIEEYAAKGCFAWWCSEPDKGVYNAMNKGIKHAQGEYLNFMNSGDRFHENTTLERVFTSTKSSDILYGESIYNYSNRVEHRVYPNPATLNYFIQNKHINHQSLFIKRQLQLDNLYDETCKISSDYRFLLHCQFENVTFECLDGIIVCDYDATGISQTHPFDAWSEAHVGLEKELISRYFPKEFQTLHTLFYLKGRYAKLIRTFAKVLMWFAK